MQVTFKDEMGVISKDNRTIAVASRKFSQLYELKLTRVPEEAQLCEATGTRDLWHRRLCNLNYKSLDKLQHQVDGMKIVEAGTSVTKCHTCIEGKQTRQSHDQSRKRVRRPLELIHSDLCALS